VITSAPDGSAPTAPRWRWLVTDLDGTLVDREQNLVPRSVEALARFRALGGSVVIATGRNEPSATRYHRQLGLDTPLIVYNGARVVSPSGERLLDLDLGAAWPVVRDQVVPALPDGMGALAFAGTDAYVLRSAPALAEYARRDGIVLKAFPRPPAPGDPGDSGGPAAPGDPGDLPVTKVMLIAAEPGLDAPAAGVRAVCPEVTLVQSEATYLEILPPHADKGSALTWLARRHGVELSRVAAIGDNPNDVPMLVTAGLGAAVGDGHADVHGVADWVAGPCADGAVADLVDRLLADEPQ